MAMTDEEQAEAAKQTESIVQSRNYLQSQVDHLRQQVKELKALRVEMREETLEAKKTLDELTAALFPDPPWTSPTLRLYGLAHQLEHIAGLKTWSEEDDEPSDE